MQRFTLTIMFSGLLSILLLATASLAAESSRDPVQDDAAEIRALQQERIAALTGVVQILLEHYRHGNVDFRTLALAQTDLLAAQFDATDDAKERIALLERQLKVASEALESAVRKVEAGRANEVESLQAKAQVLDIKIKLLRERGKLKAAAR